MWKDIKYRSQQVKEQALLMIHDNEKFTVTQK